MQKSTNELPYPWTDNRSPHLIYAAGEHKIYDTTLDDGYYLPGYLCCDKCGDHGTTRPPVPAWCEHMAQVVLQGIDGLHLNGALDPSYCQLPRNDDGPDQAHPWRVGAGSRRSGDHGPRRPQGMAHHACRPRTTDRPRLPVPGRRSQRPTHRDLRLAPVGVGGPAQRRHVHLLPQHGPAGPQFRVHPELESAAGAVRRSTGQPVPHLRWQTCLDCVTRAGHYNPDDSIPDV
jgi:hypothetical protein